MRWVEEIIETNMLSMPLSIKIPRGNGRILYYTQAMKVFYYNRKAFKRMVRYNTLMINGFKCGWRYTKENVLSLHSFIFNAPPYPNAACNYDGYGSVIYEYVRRYERATRALYETLLPASCEVKSIDNNGRLLTTSVSVKIPEWENWKNIANGRKRI